MPKPMGCDSIHCSIQLLLSELWITFKNWNFILPSNFAILLVFHHWWSTKFYCKKSFHSFHVCFFSKTMFTVFSSTVSCFEQVIRYNFICVQYSTNPRLKSRRLCKFIHTRHRYHHFQWFMRILSIYWVKDSHMMTSSKICS